MLAKESLIADIRQGLALLQLYIQPGGKLGLTDSHKHAEDFVLSLLNTVFGWKLVNKNQATATFPCVDLIDEERRLGVQVTAERGSEKLTDTLACLERHQLASQVAHLKIVSLVTKQGKYSVSSVPRGVSFDWKRDVLDCTDILKSVQAISDLAHVKRVHQCVVDWLPTIFPAKAPEDTSGTTYSSTAALIQRNPFFVGRDSILEQLRQVLLGNGRAGISKVQVISGLGGIGKTQIALEYAYRHLNDYAWIFWVNAATELSLVDGFANIASSLDLPRANEKRAAVAAVKLWLTEQTGWLLVMDNADDPSIIPPYVVGNQDGHYLLTSRADTFDEVGVARPILVGTLSPEEATEFLLTRTGRAEAEAPEREAARQIAEELGELPLALEQAASYISSRKSTFVAYLAAFRSRRLELLSKAVPKTGEYCETIGTTWSLNIEAVEQESEAAADVLEYASVLAPDHIPFELLVNCATNLGPAIEIALRGFYPNYDETLIDDLLLPLTRYSLIEKHAAWRTFSVHRLVQEVNRMYMGEDIVQKRKREMIEALASVFPIVVYETWRKCARFLPHAIQVVGNANDSDLYSEQVGALLHRMAHYLDEAGDYFLSYSVYCKAVEVRERVLGLGHADLGTSLNNQGLLLHKLGQYTESEAVLRRALDVRTKAQGETHADVAQTLANLALTVRELGRLDECEGLLRQALKVYELQGDVHFDAKNTSVNNLATFLDLRGKPDEAEKLMREVLARQEAKYGPEHPNVGFTLCNLAVFAGGRDAVEDGLRLVRRGLAILEAKRGENHPHVASALNILGGLLQSSGKYEEAIAAYQRSGIIRATTLGAGHPDMAIIYNNLGSCFADQGDRISAIEHYRLGVELLESAVGPEDLAIGTLLNNWAYNLMEIGDVARAKELYERVYHIRRKVLGERHNDLAVVIGNLGLIDARAGEMQSAGKKFAEAERIYHDLGYPASKDCEECLKHYYDYLTHVDEYVEAARVNLVLDSIHLKRSGSLSMITLPPLRPV